MPTTIDRDLFNKLREGGLRKRVARAVSEAGDAGRGASGRAEQSARKTIRDLRGLADELEDRLRGGPQKRRSEAAQKAARTRARKASARSAAAKKAAATRAKTTNGSSRSSSGTSRSSSGTTRSRSTGGTTRSRSTAKSS